MSAVGGYYECDTNAVQCDWTGFVMVASSAGNSPDSLDLIWAMSKRSLVLAEPKVFAVLLVIDGTSATVNVGRRCGLGSVS